MHTRIAFVSISTAIIIGACGNGADVGNGQQNAIGNASGSAGDAEATDGSAGGSGSSSTTTAGSGGSSSTTTTGSGGSCNSGLGIACTIDSGTGSGGSSGGGVACGGQACAAGERCCTVPGPNEICTPTCVAGPCPGVSCRTSTDAGSAADAGGSLTWRATCGYPVCPADPPSLGLPACTADQKQGSACSKAGVQCDAMLACGAALECADHPLNTMCPKSSREAKHEIRYVTSEDLQRLADEVGKIRLTTYAYKDSSLGTDQHLGFIIEDNPQSSAVYPNHQHVDLYGYASMAVAALQVQEKQLKAQQQQMEELQRELTVLRSELRASR